MGQDKKTGTVLEFGNIKKVASAHDESCDCRTFSRDALPELIRSRIEEYAKLISLDAEDTSVMLERDRDFLKFKIFFSEKEHARLMRNQLEIIRNLRRVVETLTSNHDFRGTVEICTMNVS